MNAVVTEARARARLGQSIHVFDKHYPDGHGCDVYAETAYLGRCTLGEGKALRAFYESLAYNDSIALNVDGEEHVVAFQNIASMTAEDIAAAINAQDIGVEAVADEGGVSLSGECKMTVSVKASDGS